MNTEALSSSFEDLRNDLQAVARDAEALLKATADVSGERVSEIRARTQDTLKRAYDHLYERNAQIRELARQTDSYVHENSWTAIAIAAGIGALLGFLVSQATDRTTLSG